MTTPPDGSRQGQEKEKGEAKKPTKSSETKKEVHWSSDTEVQEDNRRRTEDRSQQDETSSSVPDDNVARLPGSASDDTTRASPPPREQEALVVLDNNWELTWPIWHMLPWQERKELAARHGYHTIGAFEEYMSLQKALNGEQPLLDRNSSGGGGGGGGGSGKNSGKQKIKTTKQTEEDDEEKKPAVKVSDEEINQYADSDSDSEDDDTSLTRNNTNPDDSNDRLDPDTDSPLLTFPDDILHNIFSFLPATLYGTKLAYVSSHPHWTRLVRSETALQRVCERVYLQQSKKKLLRVAKFHHSYRFMLYQRPRVQAGGGVYVLRYSRVKPIQRDMFTEVPIGAILETVYYRYLYFEEHGSCLYALTTIPPHDMLRRFHRVMLQSGVADADPRAALSLGGGSSSTTALATTSKKKTRLSQKERELRAAELDTRVVWGTYTIQKDRVTVTAKQSWQTVQFGLRIVTHNNTPYEEHTYLHHSPDRPTKDTSKVKKNYTDADIDTTSTAFQEEKHEYVRATDPITVSPHGRFGELQLETHRSSVSGNFEEEDSFVVDHHEAGHPQVYRHADVVNYTVEVNQLFKFLPDPRF